MNVHTESAQWLEEAKGLGKPWMLSLWSQDRPEGLSSHTSEETPASGDSSRVADVSWGRNGAQDLGN